MVLQDSSRIIDPLQVIPTPITFFYLDYWVILGDLLTMDFRRRSDCREFARRGPWEIARRMNRKLNEWRSRRLIRWRERSTPLVTPLIHLGTHVLTKEGQVPVKMLYFHGVRESSHTHV